MSTSTREVALAQALADPLRLAILRQLMAGPATVSQLVALTDATQPNVSNHLALLRERGMVRASRQGRSGVYELRDATVAQLVEALGALAGNAAPKGAPRATPALAAARTCYDHLAGRLGVALFDALVACDALVPPTQPGQAVALGPQAEHVFGALGVDLASVRRKRRHFTTACLDWTERRPHLGGALGAAVWERSTSLGWMERVPGGRAIRVTDAGIRGFGEWLGLELDAIARWKDGER